MTLITVIIITGIVAVLVLLQTRVNNANETALYGIIESGIEGGFGKHFNRGRFTEPVRDVEDKDKESHDYHRWEISFPHLLDSVSQVLEHAIKMPYRLVLSTSNVTFRPPVRGGDICLRPVHNHTAIVRLVKSSGDK